MRVRWKLLGLAGAAGVAATGAVVVARRHREQRDVDADELRDRLRRRLAEVPAARPPTPGDGSGCT